MAGVVRHATPTGYPTGRGWSDICAVPEFGWVVMTRSGQLLALKADDPIRQQRAAEFSAWAQISPLLRIGCSRLRVIAGGDPVTGRRLDEHQANTCRRQRQDASRAGVKMHHGHSQVSATANAGFQ